MSKKTALDLACYKLAEIGDTFDVCPIVDDCEQSCKECGKKYFQQQADISDGGDVVRKIEEFISDDARSWHEGKAKPGTAIKTPAQNQINALSRVSNFIYSEVKKRGMEEEIYES